MKFKASLAAVSVVSITMAINAYTDQSEGYINLSGNVPAFFEVWVRGVPGDLDLGPRVVVNDRLMGLIHLKYNMNLQSLTLKSLKASGTLEDVAGAAWPGTINFKINGGLTCKTVGGAAGAVAFVPVPTGAGPGKLGGGVAVQHGDVGNLAANFGAGLDEDCAFLGSWSGVNQDLPIAGTYTMKIIITMISL